MRALSVATAAAAFAAQTLSQTPTEAPARPGTMAPRTAAEQASTFHLPPGYRLELVACEPMIREPVLCTWDADGHMFVAEMSTYVQDVDGTGTDEPKSRIVRLTDRDGDGRMDEAVTFADGLVLPRIVLPLDEAVLVMATYDGVLWSYHDADRDGKSDGREKVFEYGKSGANLEHQDSALSFAIDNWLYSAMGSKRHRFGPDGKLHSEDVPHEFAQWGLALDDMGRAYFASAGGERPAYGFQQHAQYGPLDLPGQFEKGFEEPFPLVALPDVQGGKDRLNPDGTLNHFTGCCGQSIQRGSALPADTLGDYFLCEPVGRLVRRAKVDVVDGKRVLRNAHPGSEFLRSTDANFRPIWTANGPDGCLYIVDMYRGIIQESNWVKKDSYLRPQVIELGLDANIGRGRIWRLVHDSHRPARAPALLHKSDAQLVAALTHADGWRRDTAQKLLVLRRAVGTAPALRQMAAAGPTPLARVHALWTLDGLGLSTHDVVHAAFADADARVRETAVRIAEPLLAAGDEELLPALRQLTLDESIDVRAQVLRSLRYCKSDAGRDIVIDVLAANAQHELLQAVGRSSLRHGVEAEEPGLGGLSAADLARWKNGREAFRTLCISCHGVDGKGAPAADRRLAPPLANSRWLLDSDEVPARILLHGLTGAIDGVEYPGNLMPPQAGNSDAWIADVLTYVRNSFGNAGAPLSADGVARVRKAHAQRSQPWQAAELESLLPVARARMANWKLSASHAAEACERAIDGDPASRWTTGVDLQPGLWFQIDFLAPFTVRELRLDTTRSARDYPRAFTVTTSDDGEHWGAPMYSGTGDGARTHITLPEPRAARWLRIEQTGQQTGLWWSIHELQVFGQ